MARTRHPLLHPRQIEAIVTVARAGSVHAAARLLHIPQPALSRLIAASEKSLGVALFERSRAGTRPTEAGERVLKQGAFALQALQGVAESARESLPVVRLGCIPRVMHVLIPHLLAQLSNDDAGFRLHVSVGTSNELAGDLDAARLDFVIARRAAPGVVAAPDLQAEKLYSERTAVVCGRSNRDVQTGSSPVRVRDLVALPWVLPKRGFHSRDLLDGIVAAHGLPPIVPVIESNSFESSLSMVAWTRFLTLAPEFAARRFEQLRLVRLIAMRPTLGSSPIMLEYRRIQQQHPAFPAFRASVLRATRQIHAGA
ncbi:MAG TPA: LysR family transcriptional regulator [Casimicrobiaceae bacterium]